MNMPTSDNLKRGLVACLAIALVTPPLSAKRSTQGLSDLTYQDKEWAEKELRHRGYTQTGRDHHKGAFFQYWWNPSKYSCVQVRYEDGKVDDVSGTVSTDCGQYQEDATKGDNDAAIAVGAVALIAGIAALSHQSHQRDGKHGDSDKSVAEFERGYRDGLHHEDYHNYNDTDAYSDGYSEGVGERHEETRYRSHPSHHSGYQSYVSLDDLIGARASGAESDLNSRGFRAIGSYKRGNRSMVNWWNQQTRQCVEVTTANGHVASIDSIMEGNCQ